MKLRIARGIAKSIFLVVEINLRLPSMLHGKKGFDRIVYAFNNVLNTPVTWLFHDLGSTSKVSTTLEGTLCSHQSSS